MSSSTQPGAGRPSPARAVLFMTAPSAQDIPSGRNSLACLLPFGASTFAERVLDSCSRAGIKQIDIVASDQPEAVRKLLGDGWRWGVNLTWHMVKDGRTPYGVLHHMGLQPGEQVLIGHGHRWLDAGPLAEMVWAEKVAVRVGQAVAWTGWVSMDALFIHAIPPHSDYESLAEVAVSLQSRQCLMVAGKYFAWAGDALELLHAQELALHDEAGTHVPATWLRRPWGAMSPDANVHPQAHIAGPVLVGPGCMVARGASIGPRTVLSRDVLVANGAVVRDALVLPNTFVSGAVTVDHAVVNANQVQDLRWSVRATIPTSDGVLGPLQARGHGRTPIVGRLLALMLAMLLSPIAAALWAWLVLSGRRAGWRRSDAMLARRDDGSRPWRVRVREPWPHTGLAGWCLGRYGALLDLVQGIRQWFGLRPRSESEWYALRKDWQVLFSGKPLGYFHAPAWVDLAHQPDGEALAVADAYFAVHHTWRERMRTVLALARNFRTADARL